MTVEQQTGSHRGRGGVPLDILSMLHDLIRSSSLVYLQVSSSKPTSRHPSIPTTITGRSAIGFRVLTRRR